MAYPAGIAITWVSSARAQQRMPVIGYLDSGSPEPDRVAAFQRGLNETGYVEGQTGRTINLATTAALDPKRSIPDVALHRHVKDVPTPRGSLLSVIGRSRTRMRGRVIDGVGDRWRHRYDGQLT